MAAWVSYKETRTPPPQIVAYPVQRTRTMFSGIPGLQRRPSMESFVSPTAQCFESTSSSRGTVRRLRSMSQLQPRMPLPHISPLLVKRTATVHVRHKALAWCTWARQSLRLTKHTISLHRYPDSDVLDIIVLRKIRHVGRVSKQERCLRVETIENKTYYFAFDEEEELYIWLTEISPISKPTNVEHLVHVTSDKDDESRLMGLPDGWQFVNPRSTRESITREMIEAALPEISFSSHPEPIINFNEVLQGSRSTTPDSHFSEDDEVVILQAQIATRPTTQRLLNIQPSAQPLKIITEDFSSRPPIPSNLISASEYSPLTPQLTPDTTPDMTPLTPFRESPYRYRESDAQDLTGHICKQGAWPDAHGGYADIWRAQWQSDVGTCSVAVKVLRVLSQDEKVKSKIQRRLRKEVRVWHQLRHKNVVQMYGTCDGFGPFPSMVSAWYENGNINAYLRKLGDAATVERRLKLLTEVACGLNYLHTFVFPVEPGNTTGANIVHGDLKGANVLVNDRGEAALADFGLSTIIAVAGGDSTTSTFSGGSVRWMAPELLFLSPHDITPKTCASDTYSFGSVILEILTGERPYKDISNDMQVINQLMQGYKPKRPLKPTVNPGVWDLMERCWSTQAADRPKMAFVLSRMEKFYAERRKSMLPEDKV